MRKIYVKRVWGKDLGSDITKVTILGFGGAELAERKVAEKIAGKEKIDKVPLSAHAKATREYMGWMSKRKKFREILEW